MKVKFHKVEDSRAGKVFLVLNYMSGDADGDFPEEQELVGVLFDKRDFSLPKADVDLINKCKLISKITDINSKEYLTDYTEIEKKHGRDIADLWENGKNDPQNDYQDKCHLNEIKLRGYDSTGAMYETYNLI